MKINKKLVKLENLMTMAKFAERYGLTRGRVSQLVQKERLPYVEFDGGKLIYLDKDKEDFHLWVKKLVG